MSIIQQHSADTLGDSWRLVNVDALIEDSSINFDSSTLSQPQPEISEADVRQHANQVRQQLRGGDAEGALRSCLEQPVYNGLDGAQVCLCVLGGGGGRGGIYVGVWKDMVLMCGVGCTLADNRRGFAVYQGE